MPPDGEPCPGAPARSRTGPGTLPPVPGGSRPIPADLAELATAAEGYLDANLAPATRRAYATDFAAWCRYRELPHDPATPEVVYLYITAPTETRSCYTVSP